VLHEPGLPRGHGCLPQQAQARLEGPISKPRDPLFLIVAGAITAIFLPFALAFPPTLLGKLAAMVALMVAAAAIAALVMKLRRKNSGPGP
jgi:hypothetical protein